LPDSNDRFSDVTLLLAVKNSGSLSMYIVAVSSHAKETVIVELLDKLKFELKIMGTPFGTL